MNSVKKIISSFRKSSSQIIIDHLKGTESGISVVSVNRPKARNAINRRLLLELRQTISDLKVNQASRVIILKSNVKGIFCAGADLKERSKMKNSEVINFVN